MILRFNLTVLEECTACDPVAMVGALQYWNDRVLVPSKKHGKHYKALPKSLVGDSYLLNPNPLFSCTNDPTHKAQYIRLAGRRNYYNYKAFGTKHLDLTDYFDLNITAVKYNPLLKITDKKIYFIFEENYGNLVR